MSSELRAALNQLDRERTSLQAQVRQMEQNHEELQAQLERATYSTHMAEQDYQQKIDALEKQLKAEKQFIMVKMVLFNC